MAFGQKASGLPINPVPVRFVQLFSDRHWPWVWSNCRRIRQYAQRVDLAYCSSTIGPSPGSLYHRTSGFQVWEEANLAGMCFRFPSLPNLGIGF